MGYRMLRKELIGLQVMTESGKELGTLDEIVIDDSTGGIKYLLIRSYGKTDPAVKKDGRGRIICSVIDMKVVDGHLVGK